MFLAIGSEHASCCSAADAIKERKGERGEEREEREEREAWVIKHIGLYSAHIACLPACLKEENIPAPSSSSSSSWARITWSCAADEERRIREIKNQKIPSSGSRPNKRKREGGPSPLGL